MSLSKELYALLKENYVYELFFTHVSLIQPKGKYSLSRSALDKFWTLYSRIIQTDEVALGIAECPEMQMAVVVDVDLKFQCPTYPDSPRLYPLEFVTRFIQVYQEVLREVVRDITDQQLICILLEKPRYAVPDHDDHYKNGFHLHFPYLFLTRVDHEIVVIPRVRERMVHDAYGVRESFESFADQLVNVDDITKVIDTAVMRNAWLLYGSRKAEHQDAYRVAYIYDHDGDSVSLTDALLEYVVYDEENERIELNAGNIEFHLPRILSICPYGRAVSEIRADIPSSPTLTRYIQRSALLPVDDQREPTEVQEELRIVKQIIPLFKPSRSDDRNDWMTVGWAIYNISQGSDDGLDLWLDFSRLSPKFNEARCLYEWAHMENRNRITLGTLKYFAKIDSPERYRLLLSEEGRRRMATELRSSHYELAQLLHEHFGNEFVYTDSGWYQFISHHWELITNGNELRQKISTDLVEFFDQMRRAIYRDIGDRPAEETKLLEQQRKDVLRLIQNLKTTQFKQNVMRECQEVFHQRDFERRLNTNRYLIGFTNGVYDLERNFFREGLPTDYISIQMAIPYSEMSPTDTRVLEVTQFLERVFPDSSLRRYFLDVMSETFVGYNHRKHVYYWTGEGDNGKSITQMFFEKMFGRLSIKAPTSMITSRRPNAGAANAELARAGNGVRTIFLEEPDPDEEIYTGVFKHLSGNDSIYTRDLYQAGKNVTEIVPMFKLIVICNKLPKIRKGGDKATWNRIRVIPFESTFTKNAPLTLEEQLRDKTFPVDANLAQKIPNLVEAFAWMLLQHRTRPKIDEPEKVIAATDRYRMNNDYIHQFIAQNIVDDEKAAITPGDLYCKYKEWLDEGLPGVRAPPMLEFIEYFQKKWGDTTPEGSWKGKRLKVDRGGGGGLNPNQIL
jgi:P4 family phage/plasmid primase-like protien